MKDEEKKQKKDEKGNAGKEVEKIRSFKQLRIWLKGMGVVKDTYEITRSYPKEEQYGLTSQMRRSAVSVPSNIAEGFRRYHPKEYKQFLRISMGSCAELETQVLISKDLGYLGEEKAGVICEELDHLSRMIMALLTKLN